MSPPGYQAPVVKASWCGNERQEGLAGGKRILREEGKTLGRYLCPAGGGPLGRTVDNVAELLAGRWRLRTEAVADFEDVVAAVTDLLDAAHVPDLVEGVKRVRLKFVHLRAEDLDR